MTMRRGRGATARVVLGLLGAVVGVRPAAAQEGRARAWSVGARVSANQVVGDASDFLDGGIGAGLSLAWSPRHLHGLGLRADGVWSPLDGDVDGLTGARADNTLLSLVAGPTFEIPVGPVHPWVAGWVGWTTSRWEARSSEGHRRGTRTAATWGGSAGLRIRLSDGSRPLALRLEAGLNDTGELSFARAPDPTRPTEPTGVIERDVAILSLGVGLVLGF